MDSPSLIRFDYQDADEYQSAEEGIEVLPDSESEGYELEMESITGKGINRLCSELLELKKASDEDFLKNIYSNYSAFMRIFEEFEGIESEIMKMKNHVSTQNMLVEELMNSFHSEIILEKLENLKDECVEDLDLDFPTWMETRMQNILETLDILMSEHRMEEALVVLEKETQNMQKLLKEKDGLLPIISPFAYAISELQTALAQQFASLAGHRRVTWPELHNALFGLCRLGESDRAIVLLLNFYHLQLENSVKELKCLAPFPHETYTLELTKVVFSTICQATRSFVLLFGESSPYTLDLMQWTRVELEVIYHSFDMSVKSMSETSFALGLAVETMNISFSFCSLLEHERLSLRADVIKLMKPCITEVLKMHFDQLRKVVSLFASIDNWVLGKFPFSGKFSNKSPLMEINGKLEYLQLTSSGRKFITLMQMVLDDAFPFRAFHLENLILKGLSDLVDEYTLNLEKAIAISGYIEECDFPSNISNQKLHQQISILVNSFVLVHLLPTIVQNSFNATIFSRDVVLPEQDKLSLQKELDLWKQAIQEVSNRLKSCFCQQFVSGIMNPGNSEAMKNLDACSCGYCLPGSSEDPMPSFVFQELFVRLRHLEEQFESILLVEDGMMNSLLNGIMMTVIFRLSESWEFLQGTKNHKQLLLDVHFMMEIARVGGYLSDNLMAAALDFIAIMKGELYREEFHLNSEISEEEWASNAAKLAIKTLFEAEIPETKSKYNPPVDIFNKCTEDNCEGTQAGMDGFKVYEEDVLGTGDSSVTVDGEFFFSMEDSTRVKTQIKIIQPLQNPITGAIDLCHDDEGSSSPTIFNSCMEDDQAAAGSNAFSDRLRETNSIDDFIIISEAESGRNSDLDTTAKIDKPTGISESESNRVDIQLPDVLENLEPNRKLEHHDVSVNVSLSALSDVNGSPSDMLTGAALQTKGMIDYTGVTVACHLVATEEGNLYESCNGADEMSKSVVQHSKEIFSAKETDQNDRTEVEHEMTTCEFELMILTSNDKDLSQERISNDECGVADPIAISMNNPCYFLESIGGQERPKHTKAVDRFKHSKVTERLKHGNADGIGKNIKGRTTRPQWQ
ncbi:hypothetical protein IEQ34_001810 [Dendrobium chrysotoxum]|uniref:Exocyst component Exo84 C-terminal domain-containing protein n=1 Tax=Dendrobium chrysotoxum TaxID=161865 RepID=A0AAV7HRH5_DENCH|nr:hypothetical protein IEQ34_001810 [Dendrobium chrysotoxum]